MSISFAIVFILATCIIALVSPFWGFFGLVCSILIRFQDRFESIAVHPTFLYMSIACVIGFTIHRNTLGNTHYWPDKHWRRFLGWTALGLLIMAPFTLINEMKFLLSSLVMYYFASRCLTTEKRYLIFFVGLISVSAGMGYEAVESFTTDLEESPFAWVGIDERRMIGLGRYSNANEFGALMIMPLGLLLCLALLSRSLIIKAVCAAIGAFLIYAMIQTSSRTCMAIVGIMFMVVAALWGRGNVVKRAIILSIAGVALLGAFSLVPGPIQERLSTVMNYQEDASFQGRTRAWAQGFHMARHQPIFGVGMSQWPNYHGKAPHNSFVQAMAETGFPGIFFYVCALFFSFKTTIKIIEIPDDDPRYNPRTRILAICLTTTLVGYIVYAFFGNQAYTPFMYIYSGLCAGLANLVKIRADETVLPAPPQDSQTKPRRRKSLWTPQKDAAEPTETGPAITHTPPTAQANPKPPRFPQAPM